MFGSLAKKVFGSANDRLVKKYQKNVDIINAMSSTYEAMSDDELRAKTEEFRNRIEGGETLDSLLPEAFATVREAAQRSLGMRHFDVQLIGGMVLHEGRIAEMKTGEGKTLVATLAAYLNALDGKGVHVVTVNDYLAERDAEWMSAVYKFLGLSVGVIINDMDDEERQLAYGSDITYATNNELGFDYLRDNMKYSKESMVQRPHNFAVVDEVDSILIDEARTPLIISGPVEDNSELYIELDKYIPNLIEEAYEIDEKGKNCTLTEEGVEHMEQMLAEAGLMNEGGSLYDIHNITLLHHTNQALRAHKLFTVDKDYLVKDNKVVLIDEFTGRMMDGRRYSDGLHQALEAKENVAIQNENQTLASVTFQNYFRLYPKLAGMTGTAMTEASEFADIYSLEVIEIPTNVPVARQDSDDEIYRTPEEKYMAVIEEVKAAYERNQPVLVGTVSIEQSELLSKMLKKDNVPHEILNARHHEREAQIIAQAGRPGALTIATNMAGRGTDIKLGGNADMMIAHETEKLTDEKAIAKAAAKIEAQVEADKEIVLKAGGLYVIGTERHESRRIDNQLRGRSGRQGDPGASKFYLSLQDDLMRIFGSERIDGMLQKLGLEEGEAIFHPWMNKAIERAQTKVEARNYDIRKNLLKFDDVMNDQRKAIFEQRIELMESEDVREITDEMRESINAELVSIHIPAKSYAEQWDTEGLEKQLSTTYNIDFPISDWAKEEGIADKEILERVEKQTSENMDAKEAEYGEDVMQMARKRVLMQTLDHLWKEHLHSLDHLRSGIYLRAYGQKDPLNEYKQEAFSLFEQMLSDLREKTTERLAHLQIRMEMPPELAELERQNAARMQESRQDPALKGALSEDEVGANITMGRVDAENRDPADPTSWGKVGRNEPCPCGSGKKFKQCHGKVG